MKKEVRIITDDDGTRYYLNGQPHREDGPAIEWASGRCEWYLNGKLHREDGPALEWPSGTRMWFRDGKRHRVDGPAIEYPDGMKEHWVDGVRVNMPNELVINGVKYARAEEPKPESGKPAFKPAYERYECGQPKDELKKHHFNKKVRTMHVLYIEADATHGADSGKLIPFVDMAFSFGWFTKSADCSFSFGVVVFDTTEEDREHIKRLAVERYELNSVERLEWVEVGETWD